MGCALVKPLIHQPEALLPPEMSSSGPTKKQRLSSLCLKTDVFMGSNPTSAAPAAGSDVLRTTEPPALSPAVSPLGRGDMAELCWAARSPLPLPAQPGTRTTPINNDTNSEHELRGAGMSPTSAPAPGRQVSAAAGAPWLVRTCSRRARPCSSSPALHQRIVRRQHGRMPSTVPSSEMRPCERNAEGHSAGEELSDINGKEIKSPSACTHPQRDENAS